MNLSMMILILLGCFTMSGNDSYLQRVRSNYTLAANDGKVCSMMMNELAKTENDAVLLAYLGGFKAIWAKHVNNPINKLNTFKEGTSLIEKAVRDDRTNIEIRFVRLSVQKNCPFFLDYKKNIEEDTRFINANKNRIGSSRLRNMLDMMNNGTMK